VIVLVLRLLIIMEVAGQHNGLVSYPSFQSQLARPKSQQHLGHPQLTQQRSLPTMGQHYGFENHHSQSQLNSLFASSSHQNQQSLRQLNNPHAYHHQGGLGTNLLNKDSVSTPTRPSSSDSALTSSQLPSSQAVLPHLHLQHSPNIELNTDIISNDLRNENTNNNKNLDGNMIANDGNSSTVSDTSNTDCGSLDHGLVSVPADPETPPSAEEEGYS